MGRSIGCLCGKTTNDMSQQLTLLEKCLVMMRYLGCDEYTIPTQGINLPTEVEYDGFRPDKLMKLCANGTLKYVGLAYHSSSPPFGYKVPTTILGIKPPFEWLERAYSFLSDDVSSSISKNIERNKCNMANAKELVLKFNGLSFLQ
jgi:hypothetical protein